MSDQCREAFEKDAVARFVSVTRSSIDGYDYAESRTEFAWSVWQAAWNARSAVVNREQETAEYRQDELDAVMYFVDKWFEKGDPRLKDNPATRASTAREIALRAIEATRTAVVVPSVEEIAKAFSHASNLYLVEHQYDEMGKTAMHDARVDAGIQAIHDLLLKRMGGEA